MKYKQCLEGKEGLHTVAQEKTETERGRGVCMREGERERGGEDKTQGRAREMRKRE